MIVLEEENKLAERDRAVEEIAARLGVRAERGKRFAELTSLRVGGAIDWVIAPDTEEQAAAVVYELDKAGIGWRPLGSGSNVLADATTIPPTRTCSSQGAGTSRSAWAQEMIRS